MMLNKEVESKKKIAVIGKIFVDWAGGIDLLRILFAGLLSTSFKDQQEIFLFVPERHDGFKWALRQIFNGKLPRIFSRIKNRRNLRSFFDARVKLIFYHDNTTTQEDVLCSDLSYKLNINNIDVIICMNGSLGENFNIPWVGYITDFRYKYDFNYVNMGIKIRENEPLSKKHSEVLRDARAILVNSKLVKRDIELFALQTKAKIFVLPFSPIPKIEWLNYEKQVGVKNKYGLPDKYFLISNYFNPHDSHITAFEAFAKFKDKTDKDAYLVLTGGLHNGENPGYFSELMEKVECLGIMKKIKILGFIPKKDQIQIMKNAIAVVQPTLFEGGPGGGCIYDAISLGVRAIVSDIPVNLELCDYQLVTLFKAGDSNDLCEKMYSMLDFSIPKNNKHLLIENGKFYAKKLGSLFQEVFCFIEGLD